MAGLIYIKADKIKSFILYFLRDRLLALLPSEKESRLADSTTTSSDLFRNQDILTVALYKYKVSILNL